MTTEVETNILFDYSSWQLVKWHIIKKLCQFANFMRLLKVKQPTVSSLAICSLLGFTMRNYASFLLHYGLQADVKWHLSYSDSEAERKKKKKFHYCVQI